ncbi:hypothetical protein [Streptosporangium nondiastaticum]|uniref:hypothetical protein n=1 Tax=Streptosporangium nondiastaticum TaxID=35764 RepID=UPI001CB9B37B|nr:hypothetical protein [Streptosporangium nondiastaticum]
MSHAASITHPLPGGPPDRVAAPTLQVPIRDLGCLLRRPLALLAGLALHLIAPLLVVPAVALAPRGSPNTDGGSGIVTAVIMIVAMPVAAGATVWTGKGDADQPVMVGLVLASTLLSPFTIPLAMGALSPLLGGNYAGTLDRAAHSPGFALTTVLHPGGAGHRSATTRVKLPDGTTFTLPASVATGGAGGRGGSADFLSPLGASSGGNGDTGETSHENGSRGYTGSAGAKGGDGLILVAW